MYKVYIISPAEIATGGTELLQQLCFFLRKNGLESFMYYTEKFEGSPVENKFREYKNPRVDSIPDTKTSVVIIPETRIDYAKKYKKIIRYFWWLSVDNYYGSKRIKTDFLHRIVYSLKDKINNKLFTSSFHLVQSKYAMDYLQCEKNIGLDQIVYLSDYLNKTYLEGATTESNCTRKNRVLYNPRKGYEFTKKIIDRNQDIEWFALKNLSNVEMQNYLKTSKVYIDFGNHPGKDRIPREAAICGCCIITGRRGAASNDIDIPIPVSYKFDDRDDKIEEISKRIRECINDYDSHFDDFSEYRKMILNEEERFQKDIIKEFGKYI